MYCICVYHTCCSNTEITWDGDERKEVETKTKSGGQEDGFEDSPITLLHFNKITRICHGTCSSRVSRAASCYAAVRTSQMGQSGSAAAL